ncbi:hypothetical protein CRUP_022573, partial [Coryphaenoides rupestris]
MLYCSTALSPSPSPLSRPMQRKLVSMVTCQLVEEEGRVRALRAARSLGERAVTELILQHQNPQLLSASLWAAKLEARFPQASKTSIGHVVQLLYRASCFKVTKRDEDSSLMQLKEEFRSYEALRREHDAQIVHIAMEAGLRISPEQWSSLLYGDLVHKSHMQSIIDKLQSPESFAKSVQELAIVLQRTGDPANLGRLTPPLELLANIDHNPDAAAPAWAELEGVMLAGIMGKTVTGDEGEELSAGEGPAYKRTPEHTGPSAASETVATSMCRPQLPPRGSSGPEEPKRAPTGGPADSPPGTP